jgi:Protein of unknown function (DUF1552)
MRSSSRWSRRAFMRAAGISLPTAGLAALFPLPAAAGAPPKRLILLTHGQGAEMTTWNPTGTESNFQLSTQLSPFNAVKDRLLVLSGVDNQAAYFGTGGGHFAQATLWTGVALRVGDAYICGNNHVDWPHARSVDQIIAERVGAMTPFPAFHWGTWPIARNGSNQGPNGLAHYRGPSDPIEPVLSPDLAFDRLFSGVAGGIQAAAKVRAERRSVIDIVRGELNRLRAQLPSGDRARLDAHLQGVRKLENELQALDSSCVVPTRPRGFTTTESRNFSNHPLITKLQFQLMAQALACDLTRVACFSWPHSEGEGTFLPQVGFSAFGSFHTNAHELTYDEVTPGVPVTPAQRQAARTNLANLTQWRSKTIVEDLWNVLAPEVRDHTTLTWATDMSEPGAHSNRNVPIVILQGAGVGAFRTGRYLKWGSFNGSDVNTIHLATGGPHTNQLLVSLCHAMGLNDINMVGESNVPAIASRPAGFLRTGPITELL